MLIGYGSDILNQSTVKYKIVSKYGDWGYLVQRITEAYRPHSGKYLSFGELEIVSELKNIKEEEV